MARIKLETDTALDMPLYNTDSIYDLISGYYVQMPNGQWRINGGLDLSFGVVGKPNTFKSLISGGLMSRCANLYASKEEPPLVLANDSENSMKIGRQEALLEKYENFGTDPIGDGNYIIVNKASTSGEDFWHMIVKHHENTIKSKPEMVECVGMKLYPLTFVYIDSLSEFEFSGTIEAVRTQKKDDSSLNTVFMREGLVKTRLLRQINSVAYRSNIRFVMTVHVGRKSTMGETRFSKPTPELKFLKDDEALKGVPTKFHFLVNTVVTTSNSTVLKDGDRKPLYPMDKFDITEFNLQLINTKVLRNKNGGSGLVVPMVCYQNLGLSHGLSAFYYLYKEHKQWGFHVKGNRFSLVIMPDITFTRKSISAESEKPHIYRALLLTAHLKMIEVIGKDTVPDIEQLYERLIQKGYDFNKFFACRGHWVHKEKKGHHMITSKDLLEIYYDRLELKWALTNKG